MNAKETEKQTAIATLREILKPGDTVYCVLRHRSASGMSRRISFVIPSFRDPDSRYPDGKRTIFDITYYVGRALGYARNRDDGGLSISGCGMDMGFHVVYNLGYVLFGDGFICSGPSCPSNDHSNGDRDYSPHPHQDGGYALESQWL